MRTEIKNTVLLATAFLACFLNLLAASGMVVLIVRWENQLAVNYGAVAPFFFQLFVLFSRPVIIGALIVSGLLLLFSRWRDKVGIWLMGMAVVFLALNICAILSYLIAQTPASP